MTTMFSKDAPLLYKQGTSEARGFINPAHSLLYLYNTDQDTFVIFSIGDLAAIIVAHQKRYTLSTKATLPMANRSS